MNRHDPAAAGFTVTDGDNGETAAAENDDFSNMLRDFDYFTENDLLELMWQGGGGGTSCFEQPAASPVSYLRLSPSSSPAAPPENMPGMMLPPETVLDHPAAAPSEEEMAAWLYPIVSGEVAGGRTEADDVRRGAPLPEKEAMEDTPDSLTTTKDVASDDSGERKKKHASSSSAGGARTRFHHAGAHNLTEKRRRFKITEKLRTLQRLVPGCDKSNQASTLDQTIQYMKSLQDQLKAMSVVPPPAVYPPHYMPPQPAVTTMPMPVPAGMVLAAPGAPPPAMVPFGAAMLPYPPYPAVLLPPPPPPPLYRPPATAPRLAPASRRHGSTSGGRRIS